MKCVQIGSHFWSVFSPNTGKYGPEIIPYLDTFHAVKVYGIHEYENHFFINKNLRNLENSQNLNFPYFTLTYFKVKRISTLALIYFDLFIFFSFFFRNISWKRSHKTWNVRLCRKLYLHVTYIPYWFLLHKISFKITASSKRCIIDWFVWW